MYICTSCLLVSCSLLLVRVRGVAGKGGEEGDRAGGAGAKEGDGGHGDGGERDEAPGLGGGRATRFPPATATGEKRTRERDPGVETEGSSMYGGNYGKDLWAVRKPRKRQHRRTTAWCRRRLASPSPATCPRQHATPALFFGGIFSLPSNTS